MPDSVGKENVMNQQTALIAMSGGVDSSVAAYLMKEQGYDCVGGTMRLHNQGELTFSKVHLCSSPKDIEDAEAIADKLGIPYHVFNFMDDFEEKIIDPFIEAYEAGRTPNPCVRCNKFMKFDRLHQKARDLGLYYLVTGHYAQVEEREGVFFLKKAADPSKDQSYVLYNLTQDQLAHTLFPLGGMSKSQTREIADRAGFINADKPDSMDICFVPDGDYARVIEERTGRTYPEGDFVTPDGELLGRHKGIIHYTIGQRRGLGIASAKPLYVLSIDPLNNRVILGHREDLFSSRVLVERVHWISGEAPSIPFTCKAKIRYRQQEEACRVTPLEDGTVTLDFDRPQRAVTPGQAAVFYDGDYVLGGGTIVQ